MLAHIGLDRYGVTKMEVAKTKFGHYKTYIYYIFLGPFCS